MSRGAGVLAAVMAASLAWFLVAPVRARQDRHWLELNGTDWTTMDSRQQAAWMQGFLAGRALGQLPDSVRRDTLAAPRALQQMRQAGTLAFRYAVPLYTNRLNDFYHWENHRSLPLWRGMEDLNAELERGVVR